MRVVLIAMLLAACGVDDHPFVCERDDQCGTNGRCEAEGYCSAPDAKCTESGYRFVNSSSPELANECVLTCAEAVYAGGNETCVRRTDKTIVCGDETGLGPVEGLFDGAVFTSLAIGGNHMCGIDGDGMVACWGGNETHEVSPDPPGEITQPYVVMSGDSVVAGVDHTCATANRTVKCWGDNSMGQLGGDDIGVVHETPVSVLRYQAALLDNVSVIAASATGRFTCASASPVGCWGANESGQLGDGGTTTRDYFEPIGQLNGGALPLAVGSAHGCIAPGSGVACWGVNTSGQLGNPSTENHQPPTTVPGLGAVTHLAAGSAHTCAVLADGGQVVCWGLDDLGQRGDAGLTGLLNTTGVVGATSIAAGSKHTCAVVDQRLVCWGAGFGATPAIAKVACRR